jgi:MFS family permease
MVGMVTVFILGKYLSWRWIAGLSCAFPLLSLLVLGFIPESPAWLVTQDRPADARQALLWLRGEHYDITEEFHKLEASYKRTQTRAGGAEGGRLHRLWRAMVTLVSKLGRPDVFKPLLLVTTLSLLQQFTGTATTTYYAVTLMGEGKKIDKHNATIIYGFTR